MENSKSKFSETKFSHRLHIDRGDKRIVIRVDKEDKRVEVWFSDAQVGGPTVEYAYALKDFLNGLGITKEDLGD